LHDHRITGIGWVGLAQKHSITVEHDVIEATARRENAVHIARTVSQWVADLVGCRVDNLQVAIAVVVVEDPYIPGRRVIF
jgi:hypothetical protein